MYTTFNDPLSEGEIDGNQGNQTPNDPLKRKREFGINYKHLALSNAARAGLMYISTQKELSDQDAYYRLQNSPLDMLPHNPNTSQQAMYGMDIFLQGGSVNTSEFNKLGNMMNSRKPADNGSLPTNSHPVKGFSSKPSTYNVPKNVLNTNGLKNHSSSGATNVPTSTVPKMQSTYPSYTTRTIRQIGNNTSIGRAEFKKNHLPDWAIFEQGGSIPMMFDGGDPVPQGKSSPAIFDAEKYRNSAIFSYYKNNVLMPALRNKNPEAYDSYMKGLSESRKNGTAQNYIQTTPYDLYLSEDEQKSVLGNNYDTYKGAIGYINNLQQNQTNLKGATENSAINFGRRFASLGVTPSFSLSGAQNYNIDYDYSPEKGVTYKESGTRPANFKLNQGGGICYNCMK
jgi:hypothetical protein